MRIELADIQNLKAALKEIIPDVKPSYRAEALYRGLGFQASQDISKIIWSGCIIECTFSINRFNDLLFARRYFLTDDVLEKIDSIFLDERYASTGKSDSENVKIVGLIHADRIYDINVRRGRQKLSQRINKLCLMRQKWRM